MTNAHRTWGAEGSRHRRTTLSLLTILSLILAQLALLGSPALAGTEEEKDAEGEASAGEEDDQSDSEAAVKHAKDEKDADDEGGDDEGDEDGEDRDREHGDEDDRDHDRDKDGKKDRDRDRDKDESPEEPEALGTLKVTKVTDPAGSDESFTVTLMRGDKDLGSTVLAGDGASDSIDVPAGKGYRLIEDVPEGWDPEYDVACTIGTYDAIGSHGIKVVEGKTTYCTITNVELPPPPKPTPKPKPEVAPTLTVEKLVQNRYGGTAEPEDFTLLLNGEEIDAGTTYDLKAGREYTVSETEVDGYELVGIVCEAKDGTETAGTFTPKRADEIHCEVRNRDLRPTSAISLEKVVLDGSTEGDDGALEVRIGDDGPATVTYGYEVTNTGQDDLHDLTLVDDTLGDLTDALVAEVTATHGDTLPVGESVRITTDQELTIEDFTDGELTNVAEVDGVGVRSEMEVSDTDSATVVLIEVLDVVEERPVPEEPRPAVEVEPERVEILPVTGTDSGGFGVLGLLLAALGTAALRFTPRRARR